MVFHNVVLTFSGTPGRMHYFWGGGELEGHFAASITSY
jgi:hypothetical protein